MIIHMGTITAAKDCRPEQNQPSEITDSGLPKSWSDLVGERYKTHSVQLRVIEGDFAGAKCWVFKDIGEKTARTTTAVMMLRGESKTIRSAYLVGSRYVVELLEIEEECER